MQLADCVLELDTDGAVGGYLKLYALDHGLSFGLVVLVVAAVALRHVDADDLVAIFGILLQQPL